MVGQSNSYETIYENSSGGDSSEPIRWLDMQNYRDPPPYPGHSKQHQQQVYHQKQPQHKVYSNQPGYRQSYSGSETSTDVSLSSTENLSTSQRQDPQGEETHPSGYQAIDSHMAGGGTSSVSAMLDGVGGIGSGGGYSILERLGMPASVLDMAKLNGGQADQQQYSSSSSSSSSLSYSALMQERLRRQGELANAGMSNVSSSGGVGYAPPQGIPMGESAALGVSNFYPLDVGHQASHSSSPLYSRGYQQLSVPTHQHWQSSSRSAGSHLVSTSASSPSSHHYMASSSSSSSVVRHQESSISSNSSSSSTLTMISRGGGGGTNTNNFSSYSSSTNRSMVNSNKTNNNTNLSAEPFSSSSTPSSSSRGITSSSSLSSAHIPPSSYVSSTSSPYQQTYMSPRVPPVSTFHHPHPYVNQHWTVSGSGDSTSSGSLSSLVTASSSASSSRLDLPATGGAPTTVPLVQGISAGGLASTSDINTSNSYVAGSSSSSPSSAALGLSSFSAGSVKTSSTSALHPSSHGNNNTISSLPPPPDYPGNRGEVTPRSHSKAEVSSLGMENLRPSKSYETMVGGHLWPSYQSGSSGSSSRSGRGNLGHGSQHDLRPCASSPGIYVHDNKSVTPRSVTSQDSGAGGSSASESGASGRLSQMVELLTEQNRALREELAAASVKVAKLHKLEQEIQKVHDSHTALVQSSQKREGLWLAMKRKLEERIHALEGNTGGQGGPKSGTAQGGSTTALPAGSATATSDAELRIKLADKDAMISKLLSQNQELSCSRDQLEASNSQLSLSLAEQRAHVDILENALLNAQSRVLTLEDENRKKSTSMDKVEQLQNALTSLQLVSEKQEKKEREMRARLEKELEGYRLLEKGTAPKRGEPGKDDSKSAGMLRKMLDEKDARILQLETQIAGMEQRYVKEATLRQLNMESNTSEAPKEVRLAALEKSSSDMERLIDEAKTEKLKHMEELHQSHRKVAELEAKVKQLQTQVVEKEAMLKVFQRSPLAMARSSSLHALCHHSSSPHSATAHSPRPSLISPTSTPVGGLPGVVTTSGRTTSSGYNRGGETTSTSIASTIRHMKTGSASAIELGRKMSMEEDLLSKVQSLRSESKSDSEEEVKLWHV